MALDILDLKTDGATVVEAPPKMLGFAMDALQRFLVDIGLPGPDKGQGGKYLCSSAGLCRPGAGRLLRRQVADLHVVSFGMRGFKVDGKTDQAVALMKQTKVYPLAKASSPPSMEFLNGSGKAINTSHPTRSRFSKCSLSLSTTNRPRSSRRSNASTCRPSALKRVSRSTPTRKDKALLADAARVGARWREPTAYASPDPDTYYYKDRKWQYVGNVPYDFNKDGVLEVDRRAYVYYMALGNSPAMMSKNIGVGSYYLWTYKDASGAFLDGAQNYKLRVPSNVPAKDFWSVLVYDPLSRSELQNGEKFPSVSKYTDPKINADGSVDVYFGPTMPPGQEKNWIKTVAGKGWFPIFRFYGPLEAALRQELGSQRRREGELSRRPPLAHLRRADAR